MQRKFQLKRKSTADRRIRILFFDHTAVLSGGELALLSLVTELDRARYDPVVVLGQDGPLVQSMQAIAETHVISLDSRVTEVRKDVLGWRTVFDFSKVTLSINYVFRLARIFKELDADVIHTNSLKSDILGGIAAKRSRIPLLWHVRDRIEESYLPGKVVTVFRALCRIFPDRIIANSRSTMQTLHLKNQEGAYVVPSGFDAERFQEAARGTESLHATLAKGEVIKIGIVGRISPWKGQEIFLRAAQRIQAEYPSAHFYLIGSALFGEQSFEDSLHEFVRENQMEESVTFSGFKKDIAAAIGELHIQVHASTIPEPLGQVIAQGMAAGKPIVATIGGGASEIVEHGRTGLLVTPGDVDAMTAGILAVLRDPGAAEERADRAQKFALNEFSAAKVARSVEAVYEEMFDRHASPLTQ